MFLNVSSGSIALVHLSDTNVSNLEAVVPGHKTFVSVVPKAVIQEILHHYQLSAGKESFPNRKKIQKAARPRVKTGRSENWTALHIRTGSYG